MALSGSNSTAYVEFSVCPSDTWWESPRFRHLSGQYLMKLLVEQAFFELHHQPRERDRLQARARMDLGRLLLVPEEQVAVFPSRLDYDPHIFIGVGLPHVRLQSLKTNLSGSHPSHQLAYGTCSVIPRAIMSLSFLAFSLCILLGFLVW